MLSDNSKYLLFWLWEYTCRTPQNRPLYAKLLKALKEPVEQPESVQQMLKKGWLVAVMDLGGFDFKEWGNVSKNCDIYKSSEDILQAIIEDSFRHRFPSPQIEWPGLNDLPLSQKQLTTIVHDSFPNGIDRNQKQKEIARWKEKTSQAGEHGGFYFIDFTKPLEEIQARIEYEYSIHKNLMNGTGIEHLDIDNLKSIEIQLIEQWVRSKTKMKRIHSSKVISRVIGLWMWDYQHEHNVIPQQAIQAFKKKYEYKLPGKDDGFDSADLRYYLRQTDKCINKAEVLHFSK